MPEPARRSAPRTPASCRASVLHGSLISNAGAGDQVCSQQETGGPARTSLILLLPLQSLRRLKLVTVKRIRFFLFPCHVRQSDRPRAAVRWGVWPSLSRWWVR